MFTTKPEARKWFYSQPKLSVPDCTATEDLTVYRLGYTGQYIIEININSGLGGEEIEIDQITDIHFNYVSIEDETDSEVMGTREHRHWLKEGEAVKAAINAMNVAQYADQTVITGDTLDFLSKGAILLTERHILSRDPEVLMTLGGHELTKQMQTGRPNEIPLEERLDILRSFWPHDIFYHSKDIGNKVICVCLDNSRGKFLDCQIEKLNADVKRASEENKIILIFMHEPISPRDGLGTVPTLWYSMGSHKEFNFDEAGTIGSNPDTDEATASVYSIITENANVIKGIFCGHRHSMFYNKVKATYSDEQGVHETTIPQLVAPGNPYLDRAGRVVRITVK